MRIRSDFDVELKQSMGSDNFICQTARVSTGRDKNGPFYTTDRNVGLLKYLMKNRHGSPFEHGLMTFRITCPIFVWREFMRHRIGFSYNEQSGRYMELDGVFYIPPFERPLVQVGKPGAYDLVPSTTLGQHDIVYVSLMRSYEEAWGIYRRLLDDGVAKEVARMCLPVALYSSAYVTCNPRSMMAFLSLRTDDPASTFPSKPQWEINQVANQMEAIFADLFPITHAAFMEAGRVAP